METFAAFLAFCAGNSPVAGEFPAQRPVTRSFDVFFDLRPNKPLSKQSKAGDLRRYQAHYDVIVMYRCSTDWSVVNYWWMYILLWNGTALVYITAKSWYQHASISNKNP